MSEQGLTSELYSEGINQLDEIVSGINDSVWASYVPVCSVGNSKLREKRVEEGFALYLRLIDRRLKPRSAQIPRVVWRHWYSSQRGEYGFLHFHILFLLDGTGITGDQMLEIHSSVITEIAKKDEKRKLRNISEQLKYREKLKWAKKAGRQYSVKPPSILNPILNSKDSVAAKAYSNRELVGYGSKYKKQQRELGGAVYECYSTTPNHTILPN
jgi:hypothetical protein